MLMLCGDGDDDDDDDHNHDDLDDDLFFEMGLIDLVASTSHANVTVLLLCGTMYCVAELCSAALGCVLPCLAVLCGIVC